MRTPLPLLLDLTRGYVMVAAGAATGAVCRGAARVAPRRGSSTLCTLAFGMYRAWTLYACEYGERACACLPALGSLPSGGESRSSRLYGMPRGGRGARPSRRQRRHAGRHVCLSVRTPLQLESIFTEHTILSRQVVM